MDRRSLLGAFVAGFCSLFVRRTAAEETYTGARGEELYTAEVEPKDDELLVMTWGGTIPNQHSTSMRPVLGSPGLPDVPSPYTTIEQAVDYPASTEDGRPLYPRSQRFQVQPELVIGTLEDIIADMGERMRNAYATWKEHRHITGYNEQTQAKIREVYERYKGANPVARPPWDHDGRCQAAELERERLDNTVPTASLKITKAQWVWLALNHPEVAVAFLAYSVDSVRVEYRTEYYTKLVWDVIFEADDPCRNHFDIEPDVSSNLCLMLANPNPWTNPEAMSKEPLKPASAKIPFASGPRIWSRRA